LSQKKYFYFKMTKLIIGHKYIITIDGTNETFYGKCKCTKSYLFSDVTKYDLINEYIGLKYFSKKDHFINTHYKVD